MALPSPSDKRMDPRFPVRIHVRFRVLKGPGLDSPEPALHNGNNLMSNISRTGFFLSTKNFLEISALLEVEFALEEFEQVVRLEAQVVRANYANNPNQGRFEYGLRFSSMHPHFRETLDRYLKMAESRP